MPRLASGGSPPAARCAAGPRTRRDVMLAPPFTHTHYPRALPGRRDGDIAPYRHYTRVVRPAITPAIFARALRRPCAPSAPLVRLGIPHTLRVLYAAACQRGLPARGTVRGRAAHPARCHDRAAIYPRHYPRPRDDAARWGHRALPPLHTQYSHRHYAREIRTRIARGGAVRGMASPHCAVPPLPTRIPVPFAGNDCKNRRITEKRQPTQGRLPLFV